MSDRTRAATAPLPFDEIVDARTHYEILLAPIYAWMFGPLDAARRAAREQLVQLGIPTARPGARALDLGAGPGFHAHAFTRLGYQVVALDSSPQLLAELVAACPGAQPVRGDLARADAHVRGPFDVVVCLGDTLPHLDTFDEVDRALAAASRLLAPGGRLAISFREPQPARGGARYVLVRGDAERILTCRLEDRGEHVLCTDILHELAGGRWRVRTSTYRKLRLDPDDVGRRLRALGRELVDARIEGGWVTIVAS